MIIKSKILGDRAIALIRSGNEAFVRTIDILSGKIEDTDPTNFNEAINEFRNIQHGYFRRKEWEKSDVKDN